MTKPLQETSRRDFIKVAAAGTALAANLSLLSNVHAAGSDVIKIGVIGCGSRGTGAADDALKSAENVKVIALADAFQDRLNKCLEDLAEHKDKIDVPKDNRFVGLDAYQQLLTVKDVNYVILATPPGFRPLHLQAAVAAGKNIFTEKPVAVDVPGYRKCIEAYELAKKKNLGIAAGTQRRHQAGYLKTIQMLHDGEIGEIVAGRCYWNQGKLWHKDRTAQMTDLEWQMRNWLYFTWLSGDHYVEQHVHNIDVINWILKSPPIAAYGMGGRQSRTGAEFGHIFDHFAVDYEYPKGVHVLSMARQIEGSDGNVSEAVVGTKGVCQVNNYRINGKSVFSGKEKRPYIQEHTDLIASIREGKPINELQQVADSTMTAILGRMSCYTGKQITWEKAVKESKEDTFPAKLSWDMSLPVAPVAIPGKTKFG